jgi:hypothetical protein
MPGFTGIARAGESETKSSKISKNRIYPLLKFALPLCLCLSFSRFGCIYADDFLACDNVSKTSMQVAVQVCPDQRSSESTKTRQRKAKHPTFSSYIKYLPQHPPLALRLPSNPRPEYTHHFSLRHHHHSKHIFFNNIFFNPHGTHHGDFGQQQHYKHDPLLRLRLQPLAPPNAHPLPQFNVSRNRPLERLQMDHQRARVRECCRG